MDNWYDDENKPAIKQGQGIAFGMAMGVMLGMFFGIIINPDMFVLGMPIGIGIGTGLGALYDARQRDKHNST